MSVDLKDPKYQGVKCILFCGMPDKHAAERHSRAYNGLGVLLVKLGNPAYLRYDEGKTQGEFLEAIRRDKIGLLVVYAGMYHIRAARFAAEKAGIPVLRMRSTGEVEAADVGTEG